jgi:manganese/zinc/iron transport system permease protein
MLVLSAGIGVVTAVAGYWVAHWLDASIAGSMATMAGVIFGLAFVLAPDRGLLALARRRARQRWEFAQTMLAIHLLNHEGRPNAARESRVEHLDEHLRWQPAFAERVVGYAEAGGLVVRNDDTLALTDEGRQRARQAIVM